MSNKMLIHKATRLPGTTSKKSSLVLDICSLRLPTLPSITTLLDTHNTIRLEHDNL